MKLNVSTSFKLNKIGVITLPQPSSKSISEWSAGNTVIVVSNHVIPTRITASTPTLFAKSRLIVFVVAQGESLSFQSLVFRPDFPSEQDQ
jgi:hypothetical protein